MPPIALAFSMASPLILEHHLTRILVFCTKATFHLLLVAIVTAGIYGLALSALVTLYSNRGPLAEPLYGLDFAAAAFLAVCAGILTAPKWLGTIVTPAAGGCSAIFPIWLYVHHCIAGDLRADFLCYLVGSVAGSFAAASLTSRTAINGRRPSRLVARAVEMRSFAVGLPMAAG